MDYDDTLKLIKKELAHNELIRCQEEMARAKFQINQHKQMSQLNFEIFEGRLHNDLSRKT